MAERAQERDRPRSRVPEDQYRVRTTEASEALNVRENGLFYDQTGLPIIGGDFRIGG